MHSLSKLLHAATFLSWRRKLYKNMVWANILVAYFEDLRVTGEGEAMFSVKSSVIFIPWVYLREKSVY